jgi:sigma-B regulation protein RsbU (phosphoserine phosphatase)
MMVSSPQKRDARESKPRKILLVDDSQTVLHVLRTYLMGGDFEFALAADGEAAMRAVINDQPHLIISDVQMPGMSGIDLCSAIKRLPGMRHAQFVLISSKWTPELRRQAGEIGVGHCLHKPVKAEDIATLAAKLLG